MFGSSLLGGLGKSSQKSESAPWAKQQPYLERGFEEAGDWLSNTQNNPNANIQAGRQQQLQAAQSGFGGAIDNQNQVSNMFSSSNLLSPGTNPYLAESLDLLGQGISRQTDRNQNTINQQAVQAGAYGGGRQGVAQGLNAEAGTNAYADAAQQMLMQNYSQGLNRMQQQQQYLPQQAQMASLPGMTMENIGMAEKNEPMDDLSRYWNLVGGQNWGGTQTGSQQASPLQMFGQFTQGVANLGSAMPKPGA